MYPYHRQFTIQIPGFPQFGGQSGYPPFGPPGYGQGGYGGGPGQGGFGGGGQGGPPSGPPPSEIPPDQSQGQFGIYAVDPGGIRGCLYRFTYIRLTNGRSFWFYPTFVGRNSIAGYRWRRNQYRWDYFGIDLDRIRSFSCR
ncbi:MAG: transporter [Bacillota bacterium]